MYAKVGDEVYFYKQNGIIPQRGVIAEIKDGIITKVTVEDILPPNGSGVLIKSARTIDTALFVVNLISTFYPVLRDLYVMFAGNKEERLERKANRAARKEYRKAIKENRVTWYKSDFYEKHKNSPVLISKYGALIFVGVSKKHNLSLQELIYKTNAGELEYWDYGVGRVGNFVYVYDIV